MMQAIKRMGILYGKFGLATDAALIEARGVGVEAAAAALNVDGIPELLRYIFGLVRDGAPPAFFEAFSQKDPTFDVQPADKEAILLATSIASYELENETNVSGMLALCLMTASMGGLRKPVLDEQLLVLAERTLAEAQGQSNVVPSVRTAPKQPKALAEIVVALDAATNQQHLHVAKASVMGSVQELIKYVESAASASAKADNETLAYVTALERELRTHWWVTGGWSTDAAKPFRQIATVEAALRAGRELFDKNPTKLGLFAAPALLSLVVESGRQGGLEDVSIIEAATNLNRAWRNETYGAIAVGKIADLLPFSAAQGLAADSADAEDWHPRFKRLTNIDPSTTLNPLDLALQVYRERLVFTSLSK
ncbi:GTPase-associated system all-helical protein GASH [Pseudomonas sp. UMAB-40]|uniref:GTPase-associated system all-helical protein GASH n=1 Tax=Pseudomonas sp. UMAB-40 TaxID=1365407 RepID=UPI001C570D7E|nr:GTPase-associated system all-helical protein GASH [Pseudomonas sp. UMAB-40]